MSLELWRGLASRASVQRRTLDETLPLCVEVPLLLFMLTALLASVFLGPEALNFASTGDYSIMQY